MGSNARAKNNKNWGHFYQIENGSFEIWKVRRGKMKNAKKSFVLAKWFCPDFFSNSPCSNLKCDLMCAQTQELRWNENVAFCRTRTTKRILRFTIIHTDKPIWWDCLWILAKEDACWNGIECLSTLNERLNGRGVHEMESCNWIQRLCVGCALWLSV